MTTRFILHTVGRGRPTRRGFTLIELLVVMSLILLMGAMVVMFGGQAMSRDRAADAASRVVGGIQISKALALRDGIPRGIRLVLKPGTQQAVAYQFIASPPVLLPNLLDGPPPDSDPANGAAYVQFDYVTTGGVAGLPPGTINNRVCEIRKLTADQVSQIEAAMPPPGSPDLACPLLHLPTLGTSHRIRTIGPSGVSDGARGGTTPLFRLTLTLNGYPDFALGGADHCVTYYFGIYRPPVVLPGTETVALPDRSCVDLQVSSPNGTGPEYDLLFAPNGQLLTTPATGGAAQVFLWVRDPEKATSMGTYPGSPPAYQSYLEGGDQLIIALKAKGGGTAVAPVDWDWNTGNPTADPFSFARTAVASQ